MGLCPNCNHGIGAGNISLAPYTATAWPKPEGGEARPVDWPEPWATWRKVAERFALRARTEDRQDLLHDIVIRMADLTKRRGEPLTLGAMIRVASYVAMEYRADLARRTRCQPLNGETEDVCRDGEGLDLADTLADDNALDIPAWYEAREWLLGCPDCLIVIAAKRANGVELDDREQHYLCHSRKKAYKVLSL